MARGGFRHAQHNGSEDVERMLGRLELLLLLLLLLRRLRERRRSGSGGGNVGRRPRLIPRFAKDAFGSVDNTVGSVDNAVFSSSAGGGDDHRWWHQGGKSNGRVELRYLFYIKTNNKNCDFLRRRKLGGLLFSEKKKES